MTVPDGDWSANDLLICQAIYSPMPHYKLWHHFIEHSNPQHNIVVNRHATIKTANDAAKCPHERQFRAALDKTFVSY
jgi:hypothetical protein